MNSTANSRDGGVFAMLSQDFQEKRQALEAGFQDMERGLAQLGIRIETCREKIYPPSEIGDMAVRASRMERKFLSLKKKIKSLEPERFDDDTMDAIRTLAAQTRAYQFNTRALEKETRRNCEILNGLADRLKAELDERRARELKEARAKAARIRFKLATRERAPEAPSGATIIPFRRPVKK